MIADTVIRQGEAIPKDIVLYAPPDWSLAYPRGDQETTVILWDTEIQAQAGADETDIVVTRILPGIVSPILVESKMKRWTGTEWKKIGTIIVYN
jgi:hypothetical protein